MPSILALSLAPLLDQAFGSEPIFETMPASYQVLHPTRSRFSSPGPAAMARSRRALSSVVPISLVVRIPISIVFYVFFSLCWLAYVHVRILNLIQERGRVLNGFRVRRATFPEDPCGSSALSLGFTYTSTVENPKLYSIGI